jgi:hypothetical protein
MVTGSCLCGAVRFEIDRAVGPFELCHCNRCRKVSGSAFIAGLGIDAGDFRLLCGREFIVDYEAPILRRPPAYRTSFCSGCGSPVPNPRPGDTWLEIHAGLLDADPGARPDRHIMVDYRAPWHEIDDELPQLDARALGRLRAAARKTSD